MRSFSVFGTTLHDLSEDELNARLFNIRGLIVTPNPEILLAARSNHSYRDLLNTAALSLPDGVAIVFAVAALFNAHSFRRHPGIDVVPNIASIAEQCNETLFIIGGYASDHDTLRMNLLSTCPDLRLFCIDPGIVSERRPLLASEHLETIRSAGPSIVIVALGQGRGRFQGKQEIVANAILTAAPNVRFAIGVGGAVDVLAGRVVRAPQWLQRLGFEWAWRLCINPWRFPRMVRAVFVFPMLVAWDTLRQGKFLTACRSVFHALADHFFSKTV